MVDHVSMQTNVILALFGVLVRSWMVVGTLLHLCWIVCFNLSQCNISSCELLHPSWIVVGSLLHLCWIMLSLITNVILTCLRCGFSPGSLLERCCIGAGSCFSNKTNARLTVVGCCVGPGSLLDRCCIGAGSCLSI